VKIAFIDPVIVGKLGYHGHAVDHDGKCMMGTVELVA
jgi:hypothetical protein